MKTLVFNTDPAPRALHDRRIFWVENGVVRTKVVMVVDPRPLADMLVEFDDGAAETDIREAIQAAAMALDWTLAGEIASRYGLSACLRCAEDVQLRPTWRLHRLGVKGNWGEICGCCALVIIQESV